MNAEAIMYDGQKKKLEGLCEEHDLVYTLEKDTYPIVLTVSMAKKQYEQGKLIDDGEKSEPTCDPNAKVVWIFRDGKLAMKVEGGTFTIGKELRTKIENILLKMVNYWQQFFFRSVIEKKGLNKNAFPEMPEARCIYDGGCAEKGHHRTGFPD